MRITKEQYEEYVNLKRWAKREEVFKSAKDIKNLEDDIDEPIKLCVAMLALLGCEPVYCCCGFDYDGQPYHKAHQYGRPYIKMRANSHSVGFLAISQKKLGMWYASGNNAFVDLQVMADMNPHWRKEECIHFAEECVISINRLEKILWSLKNSMKDIAILLDTNATASKQMRAWQYPPKKSWEIKKSHIEQLMESN